MRSTLDSLTADVRIHKLSDVHATLEGTTTKDAIPTCTPVQTISLPARPVWIRLVAIAENMLTLASPREKNVLWWQRWELVCCFTSSRTSLPAM